MRRPREEPPGEDPLCLTAQEVQRLTRMFASELDRGWIPTEHDLRDALALIRAEDGAERDESS